MSGPENKFIAAVHKHLPPVDEFYRMKNHNLYNGGIADVWYSAAVDLWVEYKHLVVPKKPETMIDLRAGKQPSLSALQVEWLTKRRSEGRNVWLIVGCQTGGYIDMGFRLFKPISAEDFKKRVVTRQEVAQQIKAFCS